MFIFGHIGITLGAAVLGSAVYNTLHNRFQKPEKAQLDRTSGQAEAGVKKPAFSPATWIGRLNAFLDIRILLVGSMLPDIIDKPVGTFLLKGTFHNGRIFSHTLVFLLVLLILGLWLYGSKKKGWLLALAAGVLAHLVLDQMWLTPQTLFWPLHGWGFPGIDDSDVPGTWLRSLRYEPSVYIPEIIGVIILVWFGLVLLQRRGLIKFLRSGQW